MAANLELARRMNVSAENIEKINEMHNQRVEIETQIVEAIANRKDVKLLLASWRLNEYNLQRTWGFPENANFFREWNIPGCICPKMDNDDKYPFGPYYYNGHCPVHGASHV
ncbi:MAG: hypothetical protein ACRC3J_05000 [Culicoidibacterales bacterium]